MRPAIDHPATRSTIRLRLIAAAILMLTALPLTVGSVALVQHRNGREAELRRTGVTVLGRVAGQSYIPGGKGTTGRWADDVQWTYQGQQYDDASIVTGTYASDLPPIGTIIPVLVDPADPTWFAINGQFTDVSRYALSFVLLVVSAIVALALAAWLGRAGLLMRSVARRQPWQLGVISDVRTVRRLGSKYGHRDCDIEGEGDRFPLTARRFSGTLGEPAWVALGPRGFVICRPGAFGLRYRRYASPRDPRRLPELLP